MPRYALAAMSLILGIVLTMVTASDAPQSKEENKDEAPQPITPEFDRCTLDVGAKTLKPAGPAASTFAPYTAGALRIVVKDGAVSAFKGAAEKPEWTAQNLEGTHLAWLRADEKVAYFAGYTVDKKPERLRPEAP